MLGSLWLPKVNSLLLEKKLPLGCSGAPHTQQRLHPKCVCLVSGWQLLCHSPKGWWALAWLVTALSWVLLCQKAWSLLPVLCTVQPDGHSAGQGAVGLGCKVTHEEAEQEQSVNFSCLWD